MQSTLQFPKNTFTISDDEEAQRVLLQLGLLGKLSDPAAFPDGKAAFIGHKHHPTHWVLAGRFVGSIDPKDDGFLIVGWPKSDWPMDIMREHVRDYFGDCSGAHIAESKTIKRDEDKN